MEDMVSNEKRRYETPEIVLYGDAAEITETRNPYTGAINDGGGMSVYTS
ncbi:hypothetical protein NDN01_23805 [Sphingomonas sp. QA11]|nr:hypothetical protein [Sphingomonas sp. QA11]WCM26972.1 hypothetical protein NDN01_23805 [Sphingomonas sp. QA11]